MKTISLSDFDYNLVTYQLFIYETILLVLIGILFMFIILTNSLIFLFLLSCTKVYYKKCNVFSLGFNKQSCTWKLVLSSKNLFFVILSALYLIDNLAAST